MTFNYNYLDKINELKDYLQKKGLILIKKEMNLNDDDIINIYCQLQYKYRNKIINVHLKPSDENCLSIFYSYWQCQNKLVKYNSGVLEYTIMKIPAIDNIYIKTIKQSLKTFKKLLKVHLRNYKEVKNKVKIKL